METTKRNVDGMIFSCIFSRQFVEGNSPLIVDKTKVLAKELLTYYYVYMPSLSLSALVPIFMILVSSSKC